MKTFQHNLKQSRIRFGFGKVALVSLMVFGGLQAQEQTTNTNSTAPATADPGKAWKAVQKASQPPMPPAEWQGRPTPEQLQEFRAQQAELAGEAADKAKDFYTRFPNHPKAAEARKKEYELLKVAVQLGNTNATATLEALEQQQLHDPRLSSDERFRLREEALQRAVTLKARDGQEAMNAELEKGARVLLKEFPEREDGYQFLLQVAGSSDGTKARALAKEIIAGTSSADIQGAAEGLERKLDALGKPLAIQFTAVDGRGVDLKDLKDKVVLIDFWATWCGPCVGEVPNVRKAYEALHPRGFEIVGISFDVSQDKLVDFVAKEKMTWPQYFDGKQWANKFGRQYGINSIPTMWLVDKKGNLRDMNARGALEEKVQKLLAE